MDVVVVVVVVRRKRWDWEGYRTGKEGGGVLNCARFFMERLVFEGGGSDRKREREIPG